MSHRIGIGYVCALLVGIVGCTPDSFSVSWIGSANYKQVVTGSVEQVSAKLQDGLSAADISVLVKHKDEELRLFCRVLKTGRMFCLMLNRENTKGGESTAVTMWNRAIDEESWKQVVKILTTPTPTADESQALPQAASPNAVNRE